MGDEAVTRAVNCCGDADSFGAITGQIAGALYGYTSINSQFIKWLVKWDGYDFATRAILLDHLGSRDSCVEGTRDAGDGVDKRTDKCNTLCGVSDNDISKTLKELQE